MQMIGEGGVQEREGVGVGGGGANMYGYEDGGTIHDVV